MRRRRGRGWGGGGTSEECGGGSLTVYSSLPLQGASRPQSEDVIRGIELALKQKGGKCGDFTINYKSLDDATAAAGKWEAGQTSANARKVAQDDTAIAYIGEFNSGASAISIPITNEAGILHVSPSNTALGLTKGGAGAEPGEPDKYYPTGRAQLRSRRADRHDPGCRPGPVHEATRASPASTSSTTPRCTARASRRTRRPRSKELGIEIAGDDSWDGKASNYRALASKIESSGADAVFTGGIVDNNAPQLYKDLQRGDAGREAVRPRRRRDRGLH